MTAQRGHRQDLAWAEGLRIVAAGSQLVAALRTTATIIA